LKRPDEKAAAIWAALIALTLIGGAIRFVVAGQDFFADELATYWIVSTNDLFGVVETVSTTAEITPPLGFMLAWLAAQIDLSPVVVRLPALIAGIGTIPLVYAIGARTVGRAAGLAAAAFVAVGPFMIFYSAEARGYGVMMAFVLLSTLALLHAIDDGRRRWWAAYAIFVALAAYTHYTSIFVLAGQFLWALWAHPKMRRPLLIATALAAVSYIPWLPSLKGDIDSPTTDILDLLSPFDLASIKLYVGHWLVGYPYANLAGLRDLPGTAGLLLIAAGLLAGAAGLWTRRASLRAWFASNDNRIVLLVLLALVTPVAEALASLLGTNVFGTRNLAASWPYVALATAALVTAGERWLRLGAAALVALGLGFGAAKMISSDYERLNYTELADYIAEGPRGVVVDGAAFSPGPLANFDVESSDPGVPVFRLSLPEQKTAPFSLYDRPPDPAELADRVAATAEGEPITVVFTVSRNPIAGARGGPELAEEFVAGLPPSYELTARRIFPGILDLQALTFERQDSAGP
jgi:4-amino-4-deoxy-L-arabinose transferase-like glycosyltransferase